jgi:hypothetical protein
MRQGRGKHQLVRDSDCPAPTCVAHALELTSFLKAPNLTLTILPFRACPSLPFCLSWLGATDCSNSRFAKFPRLTTPLTHQGLRSMLKVWSPHRFCMRGPCLRIQGLCCPSPEINRTRAAAYMFSRNAIGGPQTDLTGSFWTRVGADGALHRGQRGPKAREREPGPSIFQGGNTGCRIYPAW